MVFPAKDGAGLFDKPNVTITLEKLKEAIAAAPRNKSTYSNAYTMPDAGKSAKDANPGAAPPGKDWKPLRSGE